MRLLREGYHERLFLLTDERKGLIVRKEAKAASSTLLAEIAWLEELPAALHRYFPRVLRSGKDQRGQAPFYDMPYFDHNWVLLSELILTQALNQAGVLALITQALQVMFRGIFPTTYPEEEPGYPDRMVSLLDYWVQRIAQLPTFAPLLRAETLCLNGAILCNVLPLLERLKDEPHLREDRRPAAVRKVHGDLHPENILVRVPSLRRSVPQVVLLDPIAAIGLSRGDFAMDIAKFRSWLSAELLALRLGLFSVREERDHSPAFALTLHTSDTQLCALSDGALLREFARLIDTAGWARVVCDADPQWQRRVSFYEALYALSMVPLVPFPQSLARFLVGVRHLHNFVCDTSTQHSALSYRPGTDGGRQAREPAPAS